MAPAAHNSHEEGLSQQGHHVQPAHMRAFAGWQLQPRPLQRPKSSDTLAAAHPSALEASCMRSDEASGGADLPHSLHPEADHDSQATQLPPLAVGGERTPGSCPDKSLDGVHDETGPLQHGRTGATMSNNMNGTENVAALPAHTREDNALLGASEPAHISSEHGQNTGVTGFFACTCIVPVLSCMQVLQWEHHGMLSQQGLPGCNRASASNIVVQGYYSSDRLCALKIGPV